MIDNISWIHGSDAPEPMTQERETAILDRFVELNGEDGVRRFAITALFNTLRDLVLNRPHIALSAGGCAVALELLTMTLDEDTSPYEILMLKMMEESLEDYDDDE